MSEFDPISRKEFLTASGSVAPIVLGAFASGSLVGFSPIDTGVHSVPQPTESAQRAVSWRPSMKTFSVIGKGEDVLDGDGEVELLDHSGKGCLTHMWFGGSWPEYAQTRIRVYVDSEGSPSIDMELGLGHGFGFGDGGAPWGTSKMGKTGDPSGIYNTFRIPFGTRIRITAQRREHAAEHSPFWWILRGTENLPLVVGGMELPSGARLKLHRLEPYIAKPLEEFALCKIDGAGLLHLVTIAARAVDAKSFNYMEACMRAYIDHSSKPLMLSSGLEDYFTGTYYFNRGRFANNLAGLTHFDEATHSFSAYRFHDEDPIFFETGLRLTCRCGETEHGTTTGPSAGDPPTTEFHTYCWTYQW